MPFTPDQPFPKSRGDTIHSKDWNDLMNEVIRLDTAKVNKAGDAMTGPLTIAGSVGIGTTNPKAKLEINSSGADVAPVLGISTPNAEDFVGISGGRRNNQNPQIVWKRGALSFGTANSFDGQAFSEKLRITPAGDIGIGTTNPDRQLTIFRSGAAYQNVKDGTHEILMGVDGGGGIVSVMTNHDLIFRTGNNNEKMRIKASGNVGIGTSNPEEKLDLNGDLKIHGSFLFPNTGGGFASLNNRTFTNESSFQNNNVKFQLGSIPYFQIAGTPPLSYEFTIGHTWESRLTLHPIPVLRTNFAKVFSVNQAGDLFVSGSKTGYVVDHFVNRVGDTLEQGDVVVIGKQQVSHYLGTDNNIPIPEVDLTDQAYDSRVCGIVAKVITEKDLPYVEIESETQAEPQKTTGKEPEKGEPYKHPLQKFAAKFNDTLDYTKVQDKQMGKMVTLGAFAHCKVDADIAPIQVGDLLTTSPTKGHAQKVLEPEKAVGAIIGKALSSLKSGKGKIPVLVMLQ